jgi:hypothetical protein
VISPSSSLVDSRPSIRPVTVQNFANHRRILPLYHFVIFGILVVNLIWTIIQLVRYPGWSSAVACAVALALVGLFYFARTFALSVQDRVIRLEMRLRLAAMLPSDLKARIPELDRDQLISLRFAGDAELPDLMREVLTNGIHRRDDIKRRIKRWEADTWRA